MGARQDRPYSEGTLPAVFSWDPSVVGVAKFARYACLAFEDFALNVPRYWSLRKPPWITSSTYTELEEDSAAHKASPRKLAPTTRSLPSLGEEPDFSHLPLGANEAKALADLNQIVEDTYAICHHTTVSCLTADMGALPGWHIYDNAATNTIRQALIAHGFNDLDEAVTEYAQLVKPRSIQDQRLRLASNIAYLYVARSIPHLGLLPVDLVLEWRNALNDSLEAYRARVDEIIERSWAGERTTQLERLTERIMYELDQEFEQVQRDAKGRPLWKATRKALPGIAGTTVGITIELTVGLTNPLAASLVAAGGLLGQALTVALTAARNERVIPHRALYWRYVLTSQQPSPIP